MITLTQDPSNPERLIVSLTVTLWLDKVLLSTLSDEVAAAIRERAVRDLKSDKRVKKQIAAAATTRLLSMLGVPSEPLNVGAVVNAELLSYERPDACTHGMAKTMTDIFHATGACMQPSTNPPSVKAKD